MNLKTFYDTIRKTIPLTDKNVRGFDFIIKEGAKRKVPLNHLAYILATTYHETAATMQPIAEYGKGKGRKYGVKGKYGQVPYGRGYVQLTWDFNYEKADKELKLGGALLKNFDLALNPTYAVQILFVGMEKGWFTGKKLADFIDEIDESDLEDRVEYEGARKIINGVDKKALIATYALVFEKGLKASGYNGVFDAPPVDLKPEPVLEPKSKEPTTPPSGNFFETLFAIIADFLRSRK